ncbi:hypothetical protein MMB17_07965 [Methylobacterium organophilum]|uniref:alginate O-acetyltransferase AlgX-related protein n=1 Tax=Methylobacterium organophilum TaxID=410 RepID=UPI001F1428B3|nr:hypothetical protein [Methylobacterium organophilum]UMY19224.1 hypothetical protein MMB17_07965 [Methylobacterium organophilum]
MSELPANLVHVGRDGWLFLTAGSNNVVGQFSRSPFMQRQIEGWRRLLIARTRRCAALGIGYRHLIVPEKLSVYDHRLGEGLTVDVRLSPALRLRRGLLFHPRARRACLDLVGAFRAARDAQDLYLKTDSHWSFAGCHLAYERLCAAWKAVPVPDLGTRFHGARERIGDLGEKLDPPRGESVPFHYLLRDAERTYASPIVRFREASGEPDKLHVGSHVIYANTSPQADPRRVVLFGDSYAHFSPIMLTGMLAETFREVHFVWSSAVDWGYVERVKPDLMLTQLAERFMFRLPTDDFDLEAYARERFGAEMAAHGEQAASG